MVVSAERPDVFSQSIALIVDLDGTLIRTDLLVESTFAHLGHTPASLGGVLGAFGRGKAALKAKIASETTVDAASLPYDDDILTLIRQAKADGRGVYLASASNERYVRAVADHLGIFDGWFASTDTENLSAITKANRLVATFGAQGFDYIGNDRADLAVWAVARHGIGVRLAPSVRKKLIAIEPAAEIVAGRAGRVRDWVTLLRIHQWAKNALVLIPLLTAHLFDLLSFLVALTAFLAFSLAASGVYILNDLVDIDADRKHRSKRSRPLAAGTVPILEALTVAPLLLAVSILAAVLINGWFACVLLGYIGLTTAYTFVLKRKMMIDIIVLAALYTIRVIGGAAAVSVDMSEWLLAFSMFIFTALALIKRYGELVSRIDAALPDPAKRDYRKSDLDIVAALAAAAGFNAVTVFALYVSSDSVHRLYHHPKILWLICPILMYWIGRALLMVHRRLMDDDPILFALKDVNSLVCFGLIAATFAAAI